MGFQALRGTDDLIGEDVERWLAMEQMARRVAGLYGYQEIRTPVIEDATLFLRSVGETTDIVQKELFRFPDRGGQEIALRPEGTAPVVRAYLQHHLHKAQGLTKLFYLGPMFRAERPQAGRFRQFHQYGVEAIGSSSPWVDVEVIVLCLEILRACGVQDAALWLSSMGCRDDQRRAAEALRGRLTPRRAGLCQDCQRRFDRNVFRVLDCKNPACQRLASEAVSQMGQGACVPPTPFRLCDDCAGHFDQVRQGLCASGIRFDDTKTFARGLDYYTRTVFEVRAAGLGAQDAVAAGGRYDHLVEEFGGPLAGAVGFAAGIERLLLAVTAGFREATRPVAREGLYLALAEPSLVGEGFPLIQALRARGVRAELDFAGRSLKGQLRAADKAGYRLVGILGEAELKQRAVTVKDLERGGQETVSFEVFTDTVASRLQR